MAANNFGETQILAEILACGYENNRLSRTVTDQTIFVARVVSYYVTFYKAVVHKAYWGETVNDLPRHQSIAILRWPGEADPMTGLNLAEPDGRRSVFEALVAIRESLSVGEENEDE